jgi:hypothetical protein
MGPAMTNEVGRVLKKSDVYSSLWKSCDSRSLFTKVDRAHVFPDHMAPLMTQAGG